MFEAIGERVREYFEEHSEEMLKTVKNLVLENLPEIIDLAGKVAKEIGKNAKIFLK
ncbi:MAG: hypothetical protein IJP89_06070 [Synergistaceae bacterium]|nr:hypothetical protein [Synergistaceae bacterium]MBR0258014.1 hypothetical protein [Synergistaceae bacterium]